MSVVGPGAVTQQDVIPSPTLEGATEYEYVTLLNPLPDDFAVRVAQDISVNMPIDIRNKTGLIQDGSDVVRNYGLDLKNPDFRARKHLVNDTVVKSGQTINLKGSEAQVAVRQLVNYILQTEGKSRLMADPNLRKEVEDRIIIHRGSIQELMDGNIQSARSQIDAAITQSNGSQDEEAFPGIKDPEPKLTGRPKKAA